jgi:phosphoenolpyruvate synthase/pyruvate phosphate dikinase
MAATRQIATNWICDLSEGSRELRDLLAGKGAGIAEMTGVLGPERLPAGFTIKTAACGEYGSDPAAIPFFHVAGLDYLNCSPFRLPIAAPRTVAR